MSYYCSSTYVGASSLKYYALSLLLLYVVVCLLLLGGYPLCLAVRRLPRTLLCTVRSYRSSTVQNDDIIKKNREMVSNTTESDLTPPRLKEFHERRTKPDILPVIGSPL